MLKIDQSVCVGIDICIQIEHYQSALVMIVWATLKPKQNSASVSIWTYPPTYEAWIRPEVALLAGFVMVISILILISISLVLLRFMPHVKKIIL